MATTVHNPQLQSAPAKNSGAGNSVGGNLPGDVDLRALLDPSGEPARTGVWVGLAAITMTFAALTSALFVREGSASTDWHHIALPRVLFLNTLVLIASSIALEVARRKVASFARGITSDVAAPLLWLYGTLGLGLLFVVGQYQAWLQLRAQGLFLASNPNSSFFYVLTAVHAVHVLGGLGGLLYVISKLQRPVLALHRSTLDSTSYYWHFMGVLWIYLLFVIWIKL
jgi:cytochrome c oxidase subunit III